MYSLCSVYQVSHLLFQCFYKLGQLAFYYLDQVSDQVVCSDTPVSTLFYHFFFLIGKDLWGGLMQYVSLGEGRKGDGSLTH